VKQWIKRCEEKHDACAEFDSYYVPKRLLVIGSARFVYLRNMTTWKSPVEYTCLSYCWGDSSLQSLKTTKATLNCNLESIDWDVLPKTIQDALDLTYRLGVRFLWVDSLCILQDDIEDWRDQAAEMAEIYSNAYLTIAAVSSSDSNGGLYRVVEECITIPPSTVSDKPFILRTRPEVEHQKQSMNEKPFNSKESPLWTRAWTFQEERLSRRLVEFRSQEVAWRCRTAGTCECGHDPKKANDQGDFDRRGKPHVMSPQNFNLGTVSSSDEMTWEILVEAYSKRQITYPNDRFPAFSGIAKQYEREINDQYIAGLWRNTIWRNLLWTAIEPGRRIAKWIAPSWSWASV
ncbi:HET-domain-containing protein, partial [Patellaria atrata CBS 101060]